MDGSNILIHCVFVPIILFSMFGLSQHFISHNFLKINWDGPSLEFGAFKHVWYDNEVFIINCVVIQWLICGIVYLMCDLLAGSITFGMGVFLYKAACFVNSQETVVDSPFYGKTYQLMLTLFIFGWATQIAGHGVYERRAPAIASNFFFMYIGPFFVIFEEMKYFFGYKQEECEKLHN